MRMRIPAGALCLLLAASAGARACASPPAPGEARPFPLSIAPGKRYLLSSGGAPFFMHGDTAWSLIADLKREEADFYLRDRKARGFNTLLVNLLEHRFARNAPANAYGDRPFEAEAFGVPDEQYFKHADWVLERACELGFVVLLAPAYLGYGGGIDGWYSEMEASGEQRLRDYGRFVGKRYGSLGNVLWVQGGDYNPPDKTPVRVIAEGVRETDPDGLQTAHNAPETAALDYWDDEPWLSVNNAYTYEPVHAAAIVQNARAMPYFLMESAYEYEHGADAHRVRAQAYQAIFSGAFGHLFGNNPIWHFGGPGLYPAEMTWQEALDSPGAKSMAILRRLFTSVKWWDLEPDTGNEFLVGGQGSYRSRTVAARARDGSFALVYIPNGGGVTLDLAKLAGPKINANWFDPSNGSSKIAVGSPFGAGVRYFVPPRRERSADWILELNSQSEQRR
jgi:hypothetical protein